MRHKIPYIGFILLLVFLACKPSPVNLKYGKDICARCSMLIMDQRFGAEIVTRKGKVLTFDSIECMVKYYNSRKSEQGSFAYILVTDANNPQTLIRADQAFFLKSENFPSPMGENLSAFSTMKVCQQFSVEYKGRPMNWSDLTLQLR